MIKLLKILRAKIMEIMCKIKSRRYKIADLIDKLNYCIETLLTDDERVMLAKHISKLNKKTPITILNDVSMLDMMYRDTNGTEFMLTSACIKIDLYFSSIGERFVFYYIIKDLIKKYDYYMDDTLKLAALDTEYELDTLLNDQHLLIVLTMYLLQNKLKLLDSNTIMDAYSAKR